MKKLLPKLLAAVIIVLMCLVVATACTKTPELRDNATITLFSTNDIHGNVTFDPEDKAPTIIGIPKIAEIKASTENSILIDAGDATQGASFASLTQGADVIKMMNKAGYDVMAAGNHDFDYGSERLLANAELAEFPILAANVKKDGENLLSANTVIERAGYKIGFVGLTTVSTATSTNPTLLTGVTFENEVATAKAQIAALKDSTDAIVLVCHMGDNAAAVSTTSEQLINALTDEERSEVAALIDGHSHSVEKATVSGIPVVQTGVNFMNIGKVTLEFSDSENGVSFTGSADVLNRETAMNYAVNEAGTAKGQEVSSTLSEITASQGNILNESLGALDHPLFGGYVCFNYVESRVVETSYGDLVTDAFGYYAKQFAEKNSVNLPIVAVENGGGIGQSLPTWSAAGTKVTRGDVINAFNHGNVVEVLKVSPADLFAAIEKGLTAIDQDPETGKLILKDNRPSGSFLQCSGFSYKYDPKGESGAKVTEVKLADGTLLDRADTENKLLLATNNYVSASFANGEKLGELGGEDLIVEDYLRHISDNGVIDYDCNYDRIGIDGDVSPEEYTVKIKVMRNETAVSGEEFRLSIDGNASTAVTSDENGEITVTLTKGAHYLKLDESSNYVYVNNYSGTGVSVTAEGYYKFYFIAD